MMSILYLLGAPCQAADPDTQCATVYVFLSMTAVQSGISNAGYNASAGIAENAYLARHPGEDSMRYAVSIIDAAQDLRESLAQRTVTADWIMATARQCNARYALG